MSRSFGDKIAALAGVISVPGSILYYKNIIEVLKFKRGPNDKFIILASDGVWEYLTNLEVKHTFIERF